MQIDKRDLHGARIALAMMTVVLSLGLLLSHVPALLAQDTCPAALPTRLSVGTQGRVRSDGPNDMHAEPSLAASYIGEVQALGVFDIVEGPICADDAMWWKVNFFGLIGWTQEGRDGVYWLNPHAAATPTPPPQVLATTVSPEGIARPGQSAPSGDSLEALWTQTFDDPATWAQTGVESLAGEVKEGGYVMRAISMPDDYFSDGFTFVDDVTSVAALAAYTISFDVQSLTPTDQSQCGMIIINQEKLEQMSILFCKGFLAMMPVGVASAQTMELPVNPLDGGVHQITLVGDGQKLRLYVDGQGGLEYPYNYYLKSFLIAHKDASSEPIGDLLIRFDNVTLSAPTAIATAASSEVAAAPGQDTVSVDVLGTLWTQTFDDPATWAQSNSDSLPGEVKEGVYVMPITAMQTRYEDGSTLVETITSESSLLAYEISFDVQSEGPDLESECGLIVVNAEMPEETRVLFCHRSLTMMPAAHDPFDDSPAAVKTIESPLDPMDGNVHRISLVADGQHLRLYVDGQGGLRFPYTKPLKSFLLSHIDTRLVEDGTQGEELARFDNLTLSLAQECELMVTVTINELVVEPINTTPFTAPTALTFRYGIFYDVNELDETREDTSLEGAWHVTYDAGLVVGDRVTGFPPVTHVMRCAGRIKNGYYRMEEGETSLTFKTFDINQNRLGVFPLQDTDELVSYPAARRYRVTYTVNVVRVQGQGSRVDTQSIDMSTIQIEHNPPQ